MWFRAALCSLAVTVPAVAQEGIANTPFSGEIEEVATGLDRPWAIAFLPDGDLLVTERSGQLRLIAGGVLQAEPVSGLPDIPVTRQGGLLEHRPASGICRQWRDLSDPCVGRGVRQPPVGDARGLC